MTKYIQVRIAVDICNKICWLLESRPSIFRLSPTVSFSLRASAEQLGRGSWGPGVGPGRLLKYLIFRAWRELETSQIVAKILNYFLIECPANKDIKQESDWQMTFETKGCGNWCEEVLFTCVAVVLIRGLKVKRPCRSSSKSSPAALNICSSGVPGNILKET